MRKQAKEIPEAQRHLLREKMLQEVRELCQRGTSQDRVIVMLHDAGLSIVESAWVLCHAYNQPLGEIKGVVTAHPIWQDIVKATENVGPMANALTRPWALVACTR